MDEFQLLVDLHRDAERQGPGGDAETARAVELAGLDPTEPLQIADLGCGTGASALVLARLLNARITAVDFLPEFLEVLKARADEAGLDDAIRPVCRSIDDLDLDFENESFDVVWSEGAVYNVGFERGVGAWRRLLRPGGILALSEISWLTAERPAELQQHWETEYPEIDRPSAKLRVLEDQGYSPIACFALPPHCWLDNYYRPMQARFEAFLERHGNSAKARAIVDAERQEIELYERHQAYYGYGVYIARKL
ncbi:MAG: methyltransferase domain-containing protein [Gammaproteobacteria bacterium]|jgi:SAM-dependent methyltransferase|nr:methyltransferase domain-containing protein [Gammaproteobacteria bacterium]